MMNLATIGKWLLISCNVFISKFSAILTPLGRRNFCIFLLMMIWSIRARQAICLKKSMQQSQQLISVIFSYLTCLLCREIKCFYVKLGKQGMKFYQIALFLFFILVFVRKISIFALLSEAQQALLRSNLRGIRQLPTHNNLFSFKKLLFLKAVFYFPCLSVFFCCFSIFFSFFFYHQIVICQEILIMQRH